MNDWSNSKHDVVVCTVRTERFADPDQAVRAHDLLSSLERTILGRLRSPVARRDYLATHALARAMLADLLGIEPGELRIRTSPLGRPHLEVSPGLSCPRFSIAHADGVALCAIAARREVGADLESLRNVGPRPLEVAETICSAAEVRALLAAPAAQRSERLLYYWTLKEALAKATGLGLRLPLRCITIAEEETPGHQVEWIRPTDVGHGWRFALFRVPPRHWAAVAVSAGYAERVAIRFLGPADLFPSESSE